MPIKLWAFHSHHTIEYHNILLHKLGPRFHCFVLDLLMLRIVFLWIFQIDFYIPKCPIVRRLHPPLDRNTYLIQWNGTLPKPSIQRLSHLETRLLFDLWILDGVRWINLFFWTVDPISFRLNVAWRFLSPKKRRKNLVFVQRKNETNY